MKRMLRKLSDEMVGQARFREGDIIVIPKRGDSKKRDPIRDSSPSTLGKKGMPLKYDPDSSHSRGNVKEFFWNPGRIVLVVKGVRAWGRYRCYDRNGKDLSELFEGDANSFASDENEYNDRSVGKAHSVDLAGYANWGTNAPVDVNRVSPFPKETLTSFGDKRIASSASVTATVLPVSTYDAIHRGDEVIRSAMTKPIRTFSNVKSKFVKWLCDNGAVVLRPTDVTSEAEIRRIDVENSSRGLYSAVAEDYRKTADEMKEMIGTLRSLVKLYKGKARMLVVLENRKTKSSRRGLDKIGKEFDNAVRGK